MPEYLLRSWVFCAAKTIDKNCVERKSGVCIDWHISIFFSKAFVILYQALKSDGGGPQITAVSSEEESEEEEEDEEGIVEQGN